LYGNSNLHHLTHHLLLFLLHSQYPTKLIDINMADRSRVKFPTPTESQTSSPEQPSTSHRYAHVFKGKAGVQYLFVKSLGVNDIYQTQLVLQLGEDGPSRPVIRKLYWRRTYRSHSETEIDKGYKNDITTTISLREAISNAGPLPRIPIVYSEMPHIEEKRDKCFQISYWSFTNGGSLHSFIQNCGNKGVAIPLRLALHLVHQFLETLDQMYTQPSPVFHTTATLENLHLHFEPGKPLPKLILTNFSRAVTAPFPRNVEWDIPAVMAQIRCVLRPSPSLQAPEFSRHRRTPFFFSLPLIPLGYRPIGPLQRPPSSPSH